jgi:hypothetical protein
MFHPFKRLPFELRIAIWALSLEPRVITQSDGAAEIPKQKFSRVPAILQVCHEARKEFLDIEGIGGKRVHPTYQFVRILYPVFIAVKLDVIYMLSEFCKHLTPCFSNCSTNTLPVPDKLPIGQITDHGEFLAPIQI